MDPATELLECLRRVRRVRFIAHSGGGTGWNGAGSGSVMVESPADTVLTCTEAGTWQPTVGRAMRFSNVYRWSLVGPDLVRLEHLRFGPEQPVYLFDLAHRTAGSWCAVHPHLCREDCYSAELHLREWGMFLDWTIAGPRKQERIEYEYRWAGRG